ncbi:MAG: methionine adenosyltransferase [Methanomassiliicoccales archaeon]
MSLPKNITVRELKSEPIEKKDTEMVERKGIGHPDSVADGISEQVSRALCRYYVEHFGRVLHHNTDECQIVGGQSEPAWGGGKVTEPIYVLIVGRATTKVNGQSVPYKDIAIEAARKYLKENFQDLDSNRDVILETKIGQGSVDLRGVYEANRMLANDTSFGVGYAPLSEAERITVKVENYINGELKKNLPETGKDVKVMTSRRKNKITVTCAVAMVGKRIEDREHYMSVKEELRDKVLEFASNFTSREVEVYINTADDYESGIYYNTVTGLSMENGDDGSVGRGNRVNGLITPFRPMSLEAAAGKNPVTHVGKIYNLLSHQVADRIYRAAGGEEGSPGEILEVEIRILSQIGKPISEPLSATVDLIFADGVRGSKWQREAENILAEYLDNIDRYVTQKVIRNELSVF